MRKFVPLLCLVHGLALAAEDPALVETARRLQMPMDVVKQHFLSGCESGNPNEQFICGSYGLVAADLELDRIQGALVSELEDKSALAKLAAAQEAWRDFRDKACLFESDGYSQSRDLGSVSASCKATYTRARSAQLKAFLGCGELHGCPGTANDH